MYAFVTECLVEDSDLEFFLTTASRDVISEYCRSRWYERSEGERCLYVPGSPEKMNDLFIDKLQLDIITHCTVSDDSIHGGISKHFGVPSEVLKWDQEARERYVEYAKRGTQTVHHARGMIVGCAGAGKTTLLKRLLGLSEKEIKEVKSTEGLEVHEERFELCDEAKSLKVRTRLLDHRSNEKNETDIEKKTLTMFDFGGQCAYYACHQIYLTRRAFYVVVVDASKRLDQKVDEKVCDQDGSVFSGWTYGDYFVFWLKSIHTYCGSDNDKDPKPTVLIVATHWDKRNRQFHVRIFYAKKNII
ncbi:probable serine/threonine-protein kinase pats1 [Saccostrea cucullata]|uniref:probable serine/threonine-protein kinase pats1 n=1 Tax=Saccostrea cuccullata TaxID=36930 RepID=UPI002ED25848